MGKDMARLNENNTVINIEWYSYDTNETNILKNINDYPVSIGDSYENERFYHNGELILSPLEEAYKTIDIYENMQSELNTSYQEGINSI